MTIRKYNLLSMPFFAFFSKTAYRDVGKNWRGANLAYLFVLVALCCIPATFKASHYFLGFIRNNQLHFLDQIPEIDIVDGKVEFDQVRPYTITRQDGSPAVIIDTTGSMNYIENPRTMALLTDSSLIVRQGKDVFKTFDLSTVERFHVDKYMASEWVQLVQGSFTPVSYGLFLVLMYAAALLLVLFGAILGKILSALMHGSLRFSSTLRIATIAATPSIIVMTVAAALGNTPSPLIHLGVTSLYLFVGISVCAKPMPEKDKLKIDLTSCLNDDDLPIEKAA